MGEAVRQVRIVRGLLRGAAPGLAAAVAGFGLLAGCATIDPQSVDSARAAVEAAQSDSRIDAEESLHLQEAVRHLELAEKELDRGRWQEIVDHHAYVAEANARSAQALAAARAAEAEAAEKMARARSEAAQARRAVGEAARRAAELERRASALAQRVDQMTAEQTERGLVLTLGGVLFGFDSDALRPESQLSIARLAGFLIALGDREVVVEGYTDNIGSPEYNLDLSKRRAESVRGMLIESGVAPERIVAYGYGMEFPVAPNDTEEGRAKNRRVEVVILEPGESAAGAGRRAAREVFEQSD